MRIQLSQDDVVKGIRLFLEKTGISLDNKDVRAYFTASRKGAGVTADVLIEERAEHVGITVENSGKDSSTNLSDSRSEQVSGTEAATTEEVITTSAGADDKTISLFG